MSKGGDGAAGGWPRGAAAGFVFVFESGTGFFDSLEPECGPGSDGTSSLGLKVDVDLDVDIDIDLDGGAGDSDSAASAEGLMGGLRTGVPRMA